MGKKAPQAHTQGVGDEAHVAEILEFLGPRGSRLMCPLMTHWVAWWWRTACFACSALEEGFKLSAVPWKRVSS